MRPALRAPVFGLGVGAIAGGLESVQIAITLSLDPPLGEAALLCLAAVALNAIFGALVSLPIGLLAERVSTDPVRQNAASIAGTTFVVALWFLAHAALELWSQQRVFAAVAFLLAPIGAAGVVWANARYWLRREALGDEQRLGWRALSATVALLLAGGAAAWLGLRGQVGGSAGTSPDILLLSIDTLRRDHVSAYGSSPVPTPNLDALAAAGVRFDDAVTPLPETAPAHSAMLTGRHPARTGVLSNGHSLVPGYVTIAERLAEAGYARGAFVSSFALDARTGLGQGFQVYDDDFAPGPRGLSEIQLIRDALRLWLRLGDPMRLEALFERDGAATLARATEWLDGRGASPVFLWVHLFEPHAPYLPHDLPGFEDNGSPGAPALDHRAILPQEPGYSWSEAERAQARRLYAEEVAQADRLVGELLEAVRRRGRPLAIVFTADHGELLGEHGVDFHHLGLWEPAIRVPLVVVPPSMDKVVHRVVSAQVRSMDIFPTLLDLAGQKVGTGSEGASLLLLAEGLADKSAPTLLVGRHPDAQGLVFGYRTGPVKYLLDPAAAWEGLYDLNLDPAEAHNLAAAQPDVAATARTVVEEEAAALLNSPGAGDADAASRELLKALGYLDE